MKTLLATLGLLLAAGGAVPCAAQSAVPAAAEPNPANLALGQDIVRLGFPPESRQAMMAQMSEAMMAQMRDAIRTPSETSSLGPDLERMLERYFERVRALNSRLTGSASANAIFDAMARAYARHFSHDDLLQIKAFVSTPAGARFFQQSPTLLSDPDVARANGVYLAEAFAALQPLMDDLRREMADWMARQGRRQ